MTNDEQLVEHILKVGSQKGLSASRSLQKAGLLLTDAVKVDLVARAIVELATLLEETPGQRIMPAGVPLTMNDMKRWTAEWMRDIAAENQQALKEKT